MDSFMGRWLDVLAGSGEGLKSMRSCVGIAFRVGIFGVRTRRDRCVRSADTR